MSFIEMNDESETIKYLNEQLDSDVEKIYFLPDCSCWQTSQILSDDEEKSDFDAAPKEKPFSRYQYIHFQIEKESPAKK